MEIMYAFCKIPPVALFTTCINILIIGFNYVSCWVRAECTSPWCWHIWRGALGNIHWPVLQQYVEGSASGYISCALNTSHIFQVWPFLTLHTSTHLKSWLLVHWNDCKQKWQYEHWLGNGRLVQLFQLVQLLPRRLANWKTIDIS